MAHQPTYIGDEIIHAAWRAVAAGKLGTPQVLAAAGVVSLDVADTDIQIGQGVDQAMTLARGDEMQTKTIGMSVKGGAGNAVVTVTGLQGGTTLTFNAVGDCCILKYIAGSWRVVFNNSVVLA